MPSALGMLLFWVLGVIAVFFFGVGLHGFIVNAMFDGYPPMSFAIGAGAAIPMLYIWRFMIR